METRSFDRVTCALGASTQNEAVAEMTFTCFLLPRFEGGAQRNRGDEARGVMLTRLTEELAAVGDATWLQLELSSKIWLELIYQASCAKVRVACRIFCLPRQAPKFVPSWALRLPRRLSTRPATTPNPLSLSTTHNRHNDEAHEEGRHHRKIRHAVRSPSPTIPHADGPRRQLGCQALRGGGIIATKTH